MKAFLSKPTRLASGTFGVADTVSTFPKFILPNDVFASNPVFFPKIAGFLGFRGDIVLRLQVNANKFQQGRYMLCFTPSGGANPSSATGVLNYLAHTNTLIARTQLPHVELDLSCDTQAILRVPYVSCLNYTPWTSINGATYYGAIGTAQIFPYSTLVAPTGSTTASYTLWASFENIELVSAAVPQSGNFMTGKSISEKEASSQGKGPISSTMLKISRAADLFTPVPGISSYAHGVSWMADIMGNAASIFGWSKPVNLSSVNKMERATVANFSHVNTVDQGQALAMNCKNSVDTLPGFSGTDTDEMDFSFLVSIPAWVKTHTWTTAQSAGTVIYEIGVHPLSTVSTRTLLGGVVCKDYTPMQFVADYFNYWRGSMIFTFKLVKTEYHSGRIAIVFYPHDDDGPINARSLDLSAYVHREIVDIREASTITVAIPYVSSAPYRPIRGSGLSIGSISVYVVDPLIAPSSVSSSVSILMEVSGGPDMEFSVPRSWANLPVMSATPQSGSFMTAPMPGASECALVNSTIGGTQIKSDNSVNAAACIGEKISSFRTLLKAMNYLPYLVSEPSLTTSVPVAGTPLKYLQIVPFGTPVYSNTATNNYPVVVGDLYSALSGCYAMSRGSVRLKIFGSSTAANDLAPTLISTQAYAESVSYTDMVAMTNSLPDVGANANILRIAGPQQFNHVFANFGTETVVPQYHRYHSRATQDHYCGPSQNYSFGGKTLTNRTVLTYFYPGQAAIPRTYLARGGGDDCNFGLFVSIPPMVQPLGATGSW